MALTRAKEKLYMTGCVKDADKFKAACDMYIIGDRMNYASIMKANGYAAWIYTALRYVGECDHVKSIEVEADSFMSPETDQDEAENMTVEASEAKLDKELYDHVKNGLEFRYGYRHSGLKSKMSITEIKRLQAHGEDAITPDILTSREYSARSEVPIPAFMSEERIVHGNEIGNIYHKIMELADFSGKTVADAEKDVDRVFELGLFDEVYRERIRPKKIYKMIHSEIGQRMAAAGKSDRLYRERQFYMMMEPGEIMSSLKDCGDETIVVQGIIDVYFEEEDGLVVLDYKTDKVYKIEELVEKYHGVTAEGIVESAIDKVHMIEEQGYDNLVVSIKSSDVMMCVKAHELIAQKIAYPLHVGITESGTAFSGSIKSALGLGLILNQGIGDTIRVSLTDNPVKEVEAAKIILKTLGLKKGGIEVVSCPTCGRTRIDLIGLAKQVEEMVSSYDYDLKLAVMGCVVNGPGEAKEADLGIAGGDGCGVLIKHGEVVRKVPEDELLSTLKYELDHWGGTGV